MTPPFHELNAVMSASKPSISRWLVGYIIRQHNTAPPVKTVTDLVEQQDMGPLQREHCEGDARLLTSGQRADRLKAVNNLVSTDLAHMLCNPTQSCR